MDEKLVHDWLDNVWFSRPGAQLKNPRSLLVWDQFRAHLCESVKEKMKKSRTRQIVIPGGCTSILQPLDVSLNKPFKNEIRKSWTDWMLNGEKELTKGGSLKRPSLPLVVGWVKNAWDSIKPEMVVKSFKKCGISNAMDGTEDDMLYDELVGGKADSETNLDLSDTTESMLSDYYTDDTWGSNSDLIRQIFEEESDDDDFLGFTADDF